MTVQSINELGRNFSQLLKMQFKNNNHSKIDSNLYIYIYMVVEFDRLQVFEKRICWI